MSCWIAASVIEMIGHCVVQVVTDEEQLRQLSVEVEPPSGGGGGSGSGSNLGGAAASSNSAGGGGSGGGGGSESRSTGQAVLNAVNQHVRKRHPSPTLSTTSTTSSASATSEGRKGGHQGQLGPKFGAASPQSVRKMLALSEPSKTRPYQAPTRPPLGSCNLSMALPMPGSGLLQQHSPSPSPGLNRRTGGGPPGALIHPPVAAARASGHSHERSHSDASALPAGVDLSAESSSVTSLASLAAMRQKSGSATSSDSGGGGGSNNMPQPLGLGLTLGIGLGIGLGADMDQGYVTQFDSHSNSSTEVMVTGGQALPPSGVAHAVPIMLGQSGVTTTDSPPVAPRTRVPLYPHGTQGTAQSHAHTNARPPHSPSFPLPSPIFSALIPSPSSGCPVCMNGS